VGACISDGDCLAIYYFFTAGMCPRQNLCSKRGLCTKSSSRSPDSNAAPPYQVSGLKHRGLLDAEMSAETNREKAEYTENFAVEKRGILGGGFLILTKVEKGVKLGEQRR